MKMNSSHINVKASKDSRGYIDGYVEAHASAVQRTAHNWCGIRSEIRHHKTGPPYTAKLENVMQDRSL